MDASWLRGTLLVLFGYLLGSVPFGILVAKAFDRELDLRKAGSGNIGATNVARTLGRGAGILTLAFDTGKGILAIAIAYEINCRLMDAAQINTLGWDHTNFDLPAVALAAGRLMHLDQAQLVEAVNLSINAHLALNQTRIQTISNWKGMAAAEAGRDAIFATTLASQGLTGPSPIFEGNAGFFRKVSGALAIDTAGFGGRGNPFRIADCSIKFYPAQGLTQTAIVAAILTPPDPISMMTLALPGVLLYEVSIFCVWLIELRRKRHAEPAPAI